jgi:hypothetical protein
METGQFLMDVLAPGGLAEHGRGRRSIQRVRLMHAAVRHLIRVRAEEDPSIWDPAWGLPINQEELAGTALSFSYVVAEPLPRLGIHVGHTEGEDYLHTWNVIASMLGVRDEVLATDLDDAADLVAAIRRRTFAESADGAAMMAALLELLDELSPLRCLDSFFPTLVRRLVGDDTADLVGVPPAAKHHWHFVDELAHLAGVVESAVGHHDILRRIIEPVSRELLLAGFALERGGARAPFAIPDTLAGAWRPRVIDLRATASPVGSPTT